MSSPPATNDATMQPPLPSEESSSRESGVTTVRLGVSQSAASFHEKDARALAASVAAKLGIDPGAIKVSVAPA